MASWSDYISLAITVTACVGLVYVVVYLGQKWSLAVQSTKSSLKAKGVDVSDHGVAITGTTRLADREEYCDATQRGFIKVIQNSHYGPSETPASSQPLEPSSADTHGIDARSRSHERWHHFNGDKRWFGRRH